MFFFKQKTEYEMRISDWSSDVCSSDLRVGKSVLARKVGEALEIIAKTLILRIDHRVGTIGGDHPTAPFAAGIGGADGGMMLERIERAFGRCDHLDPEAVEKRARTEGVGRQRVGDAVVIEVRRLGRELHVESERLGEHPVHPHPRRGAAKEMIILREESPAFARVGIAVPDTQRTERYALRIEHPEYIMIGMEQQLRRIAEGRVAREPAGVGDRKSTRLNSSH